MRRIVSIAISLLAPVLLVVVLTQSAAASAAQQPGPWETVVEPTATATGCVTGTQDSGAKYMICLPDGWEGGHDLLMYAHGYVAPDRPVEIPMDQMVLNGTSISDTVTTLGYAFATTSYATNGLAVRPAISDLLDLVNIFTSTWDTPHHIYLVGVSEGGLITTLSVEEHPEIYDGGLAMCGPYGDFSYQINHFGDFRVVFDYFFPSLMPGSPVTIPSSLVADWKSGYFSDTIKPAVEATENVTLVTELLRVTDVSPYGYLPPTSTSAIREVLQYNVFATEDGKTKLGGLPFDNRYRRYTGSSDDDALNAAVDRFAADEVALEAMSEHYRTTGKLTVPLVTLHTTGDPVVPYWHAVRYRGKTIAADNIALHRHITVEGHGHCAFSVGDIIPAFLNLVDMVENPPEDQPVKRLFLPGVRAD